MGLFEGGLSEHPPKDLKMSTKMPKNVFLNILNCLKLSLRRFLNFANIFSRSKVAAGQSWPVFGVMSALI